MANPSPQQVTELLEAWSQGNEKALEQLIPTVYEELHRLAHRYMDQERVGHPLQTTALVNEAYLRLVHAQHIPWQNRTHFLAIAARLMRQVLVDYARTRHSLKEGGAVQHISLDEGFELSEEKSAALLALDEALKALASIDGRKSQVVELRFFGGLTAKETAAFLKVPLETVLRDWRLAKAWLLHDMRHRAVVNGTVYLKWGFQVSGIFSANTGVPFDIVTGNGNNRNGDLNDRPDLAPGARLGTDDMRKRSSFLDPGQRPGNLPRNAGRSPHWWQLDARLSKKFVFDRYQLELMAEAFNLDNHVNYQAPVGNLLSPQFGQSIQADPARQVQLAIRFQF